MRSFQLSRNLYFLFLLFFARTAFAQNAASDNAQKKIDEQKLQAYFQKQNIHPKKGPGGIYYTITKEGSGKQILAGETVTMNYTGQAS
jgi:FKBP-type peptidyl-prolyl cis-trans isomerase FkpA